MTAASMPSIPSRPARRSVVRGLTTDRAIGRGRRRLIPTSARARADPAAARRFWRLRSRSHFLMGLHGSKIWAMRMGVLAWSRSLSECLIRRDRLRRLVPPRAGWIHLRRWLAGALCVCTVTLVALDERLISGHRSSASLTLNICATLDWALIVMAVV